MSTKNTRYIVSRGELKRENHSLVFRSSDGITHIPIKGTQTLYLLEEVSLNTKLLDFLGRANVTVHFFSWSGRYSGSFYPFDGEPDGKLRLLQAKASMERRLELAVPFVKAMSLNMAEVLRHYVRHGKHEVADVMTRLQFALPARLDGLGLEANIEDSIHVLMQVEGEMWRQYYSVFPILFSQEFEWTKRVKRPPGDELNALLSFCNMLLYTKVIQQIQMTKLDVAISFLHEPCERRCSLALDVAEVFKPLLVTRTMLELVNHRRIGRDEHFEWRDGGCYLNEAGRRIVIAVFEERLQRTVANVATGTNMTWETLIRHDLYKLIRTIRDGEPFMPYVEKWRK